MTGRTKHRILESEEDYSWDCYYICRDCGHLSGYGNTKLKTVHDGVVTRHYDACPECGSINLQKEECLA